MVTAMRYPTVYHGITESGEDPTFVRDGIVEKIPVSGVEEELIKLIEVGGEALGFEVQDKPVGL